MILYDLRPSTVCREHTRVAQPRIVYLCSAREEFDNCRFYVIIDACDGLPQRPSTDELFKVFSSSSECRFILYTNYTWYYKVPKNCKFTDEKHPLFIDQSAPESPLSPATTKLDL